MKKNIVLQKIFNYVRFNAFKIYPEATIKAEFKRHAGYKLDLNSPKTFNEKIQWLKLNWYDPKATICADKFSVREYVENKGLGHLLNTLYGVYENVNDIDFDTLPNEFVMKVTHGCGQNLVCTNKYTLDWEAEKLRFDKWLKKSHYYTSLEWVYKDIKPRIIVEKIIKTTDNKAPKDYKIFCFNGEPRSLYVASDRNSNHPKFDFYDCKWNLLPVSQTYPNSNKMLLKPKELEQMLEYAKVLSEDFPHVRIDFYLENGEIIFGECTFFHMNGSEPFSPKEFDYKLGEYLTLPKDTKKIKVK